MNNLLAGSQNADHSDGRITFDFFSKALISFFLLALASSAYAVPQTLDWDSQTWVPEGPTNLSETMTVGTHTIPVTVGGNTAFLDNAGSPISPAINSTNTGGLSPIQNSLYIGTDYGTNTPTQVSITLDFSDYPGGVGNISFTLFDIDSNGNSYVDEAEVTAVNSTGVINPTSLTPSSANVVLDANSIVGTATSNSGLANANATFAFAQTGITTLTIIYKNNAPNVGFQWMNFHDISFDAPATDIAVQKSANNLSPIIGDPVVFTITATNNGPDATSTVNILDQLPAGITYVSDNGGGTYSNATGIWNAGAFTNGQIKTLQITGTVNPTGPYANTASLDFVAGEDLNAANNSQTVTLTPVQVADLSVTKGVSNSQPAIGSVVTFTVNVANAGPNTATNVAVTDLLPAGYGSVSGTATAGSYTPGTGVWAVGSLAASANATLTITATVLASGPYNNTAQVTASDQLDTDSTPNNNVEAEDDQQTVTVTPPEIGVAKQISSGPTSNGNGTHTLTYSILVTNTGDIALNNVQVTDSLATTFAGATAFVVDSVTSPIFSVNGGYNGGANTNLLNATDTLAIGASGTINVTVTVTPGANFGPYNNTATGSGTSPGGTGVSDVSQSGANVDPDGDGDPGNNSGPTPVTFAEAPEIGVAKNISAGPTNNGDGTYSMTYTVLVQNTGDVALNSVQVVDNLATTFSGATFAVISVTSAGLAINAGFNGAANTNLLAGTDTLAIGASGSIDVAITVTPGGNLGPYNNTATGNGTSPLGTGVSDDSQSGANVDPDGDGNPGNNNVPTPVNFAEVPEIGVAKTISAGPASNGDGTATLTYTIRVENTGDVPLNSVQVTDSLATTFAAATGFAVDSVTSATLSVNAGFNGAGDTNLLNASDTLAVGANGLISVTVTVTPGANLGPYNNTATGNGTSPGGTGVSDISQDGTNVDPDGDGDPGNNSATTPVSFAEAPEIGVAKTISAGPVNNGNGTYSLTYTLAVTNTGDVPLNAVQVTDSLTTTFGGATFAVNSVTATGLTANAGYNGGANTNLLAGTDTLAVGASGSIDVAITVTPGANLGPYNNTATGNGTSPGGTGVSDISQDGTNVDPDGDGDPGNNSATTPVSFAEAPEIGVAKTISAGPVNNGNGTYSLTYTLAVTNTGDVPLNAVQVTDSLTTTFTGATFAVNSVTATGLTANAGYNGGANTNLLAGTDTLAVGDSGSIDVAITVTPGGNLGPYNNTATGNGTSPGGTGVSDISQDGTNVDPDGDGDPGNNSATTPVSFAEAPEIGVAKTISAGPVNNGNGTYSLTYTLAVTNTGDVPLNAVQVTDSLTTTFGGATFAVNSVTATGLTANAGYNGGANTNLLAGTDTLAVGASGSIDVAITVTPGANLGPYNNTATGNGTSPGGTGVSDISQDGTNVDPDGDGDPGNNSATTPVSFAEAPEIGTAKLVSVGPTSNGDGTYDLTYTILVENTGDVPLNGVQVTDSLVTTFSGASFAINSVTSADFAVNPGFNGAGTTNLLTGADTLAVSGSGTINVSLTVTPGGNLGPYNNSATASGTSPGGMGVNDVSQTGNNVDPDNDGNPGNNNVPTPVSFVETPQIGTAKTISNGPTNNGNGTYTLTYTVTVENTGDVLLNSVQLVDSLGATYAGATFTVDSVSSGTLAANAGFNGLGNSNLLLGTDSLTPGVSGTVDVTITVTPGANLGPYNNSVTASGASPSGTGVTDLSQNGSNVDPDNDGNPGNNSVPTPVNFSEAPQIGTAKTTTGPTSNGDGSFTLTYDIRVLNTGDVPLSSLQIVDSLSTTYATAAGYTVDSISSAAFAVDVGFDGDANDTLLAGTDTLAVGASGIVSVTVTVTPGSNLGPYNNTATASGNSPSGAPVSDDSQNGTNPDPDNDGNPGNNNVPTPTTFIESPEIGLAKSISAAPINNGDGTYTVTYTLLVDNTGDIPLDSVQVTDNMATTFAAAVSFVVDGVSSATFATNASYNGGANINLLLGTDVLAPGATGTINVTVTVEPGAFFGPYDNTATAGGKSPGGNVVGDVSQQGANVDPDNDGNPGNNSDPTPVSFNEAPAIGVAKQLTSGPVSNGNGSFTLGYTIVVENAGDNILSSVQVTEDFDTTFASASSYTVDAISSATLTVNTGFNGSASTTMLTGADSLPVAGSGSILVTVTVVPGSNLGPYNNIATGSGLSPAGTSVSDVSTDGADIDPNGNGDPSDDSTPTPVTFVEMPQIGTAKTVSTAPVNNGDGTYTLTYTIRLENTGDVDLSAIQITDDLAVTYASAVSFSVLGTASADFALNAAYNGNGNNNLLTGSGVLAAGASGILTVTVRVEPGANFGPYNNTASGSGQSPSGTNVNDTSQDGTNVDPDNDGNPGNNSVPTPVSFSETPQIGIAKAVTAGPTSNGDGTANLTYTFTVENTGDVALSGLQVVDNLATTFAAASNFTVTSISSGGLSVNPLFNGAATTNLLTGADTLAAGGSETITVALTVEPGANLGPYDNLATANGTSPGGAGVMDTSTDGVDVDPDNNGNPGDNSVPTPVTFAEMPQIGLAKTVSSAPVSNGDGTSTLTYTLTVENSGDTTLNNVQVTDDLSVTYGATVFTIDSVTSGTLSANGAYDGSTDVNLLSGLDNLAIGASGTIDITVTVTPGANLGPYTNVANAQGASPSGTNATDISQDGTVPDANGNGDPGDDSAPTPVSFTEMPSIGLAKSVSAAPVNNGNGTFTLSYTLTVDNTGDADLSVLQVTDDLATAFAGATFVVDSISSTDFTVDAGFDGSGNQSLLTGVDTLATSATGTIDIQLTVTPGANFGPYNNQAQASGDSPTGATVNDLSQSGANVDPDGDGDPGNNSDPTPVSFNESPQIGVAKALSAGPTSNGNGTFSLAYTVVVENTGDVDLSAVQLNENLDTTFAAASTYTVDSVTSGDLTVNAGFNGSSMTSLLDGSDALAVGATGTVIITVTVTPGANLGPYNNTVTGTGNSPAGTPVSDDSQDGTNVDPDGNGNPGDNAVPTSVSFSEMPEIGLAKAVTSGPVENGDGSSTLTYTLLVENTGDVDLLNVQVADDLATTFSGATVVLDSASSADFAVNPSYDGSADTNVLAGTDTLAAGASGTISITVTVTPGANLGPYNNLATTTGESPAGTMVNDISTDGTSVDPDNDGDPGNNSVPTSINFPETPQLGLAEALGSGPVDNGDGTYTLTYVLFVENSGTVPISNVQIVDDIATVFAGANAVVVDGITSGDLTINPGYDGAGDTNLLAGTDTLAVGQNGTVVITVTVTPGANLGPYNNTATTTGDSPAGTMVSDVSQDGADPDPDNDGNPGNNSDPTPVMFAEMPEIGVAKTISSGPTDIGGGAFALTYNILVQNSGNTPLGNVQLTDSLALTYTGATSFTVTSVTSATLAVNPGYNGDIDANLLAGTDTLGLGATGSVSVAVTVVPGANLGPYNNSATATGDSPAGTGVSDISQNGANPDPDGDGNPGNNSEMTPVNFSEAPQIGTAKALINGPVDNGDGTSTVTYTITVENVGDTDLSAVQVTDNLATTYTGADSFAVDSVSSTDFTVNLGFNGAGVNNLLNAVDTLVIGASGTIDVTVTVTPGANLGPYENTATAAGTSPAGTTVSDDSTDGAAVDPDGDGDPSNNNVPTPVTFVEAPELGLAATISSAPVDNGDGTYSLTYSLFIENSGSVPINTLQIVDDLGTVYTLASGVVVDGITSADLNINPGYDGVTDTNLLVGTETLGAGASGTVEIMVTVTPGSFLGPYDNTATATGQTPAGSTVTDVSQDGTNPDPDGDGDPGNNSDPTPVSFAETPQIGIAKAVTTAPVDNGNGTVSLAYTLLVNNSGSVALNTVQVVDSLATTFAGASAFTIDSVTSTDFTLNAAYDGDADSNFLAGSDVLAIGASGTIVVDVTVTPAGNAGPFNNTATATGVSPANTTVTDDSTDGSDPDPDGDGDPGNNSDPTPISIAEMPQIGIAKAVTTAPVDNGNGTASLTYTLLVNNSGNVALSSVQTVETLATTFAGVGQFVVDSVTSTDFTVNSAFDGDTDSNLLTGSDALAIGASGTIVVEVTVTPAGNSGPFNNTATATGLSPANTAVSDDSTDGSDADPDADGDPGNNSDPTPVTLPVLVASVEGSAWFDANIDDVFDSIEAPLSGWVIEILQNGVIVQTTNVNPDGSYGFTGLTPGDYDLRLRNPANLATFGTLLAVNLPPGTTVLDQNLPIDPSGVVYDSDTRAPIAGATVALVDSAGNALPDACLLPDQQNQVTDVLGVYRFDVILGAAAACPSGATYTIVVTEPTGYLNPPSLVIAPQAGPLVVTGGPNPFTVAPQSGPPQAGDSTVYYFNFMLSTGDPDVINNHIPLDPPAGIADIRLTKTAAKKQVLIGELVPFTLTAENIGVVALSNVTLSDQLPAGFSYVDSSARLGGAGTLSVSGQRPVLFDGIDIPVGGSATVTYVLRVGAGVTQGDYVNTATPMLGGVVVGNAATATVTVISDPDFEQTTIIGSVFGDANGNGWQDPGEIGLPGIRLGTVEGLLVETDAFGRYHLAGIEGGRLDRGRNFIIKVDPSTLPDGALFTTENPRVQRITQGLMNSINFGVQMPNTAAACCDRIAVKLGEVFFAGNSAEVSPEFVPMLDQLAERLREHGGGRLTIAGNDSCATPAKSSAPVAAALPQMQSYTLTPRFGVRKAALQPADKEELDRIAADWVGASNIEILAVGHTSNVRIAPQNRKEFKSNYELSKARAQSVATYLGQVMGLSPQQIAQVGRGPDQAVASNATASGRARNRRVELQIKGVRGMSGEQAASSGPTCSRDLAKRRADNVMKALGRRLGKDMIRNIDVVIGGTIYKPLDSESAPPNNTAPAETVSENTMNKNITLTTRVRQGLTALMSVLVTSAHAAEMPACSIDSCMTDEGYAIQITGYTDDQPMSADDSPAALADANRVDIAGEFLVRVPGGGMMWATEDPAVKDPRMAAHAHETLPVTAGRITQPIDFYIYKNYDAFIDRAELLIFHGDDIDRIAPLATLPIGKGDLVRVQWDGLSNRMINAGDQVYYTVQAFDRGGRKDTTVEMSIAAISAIDYDGPDSYAIPRAQSNDYKNSLPKSSSLPLDGKLLVLQPGVAATEVTKVESDSYRLTPRFDTRKTELKAHDRAELDRIAKDWKGASNIRIFTEGHTDNIRIAPMNRKEFANNKVLSDARAHAVGEYLASRLGLSSDSVHAVGYGPNRPVANNSTADGRALNRRVELTISGDRITRMVATAGRDSSKYLLDPASRSSVPVVSTLDEALNILNAKVGIRSYTPDAQSTGRSIGVDCSTAQIAAHQVQAVYGRNQLSKQNIPMYGSRVRLHGQDVGNNYALAVNGNVVPVDTDGKFAVDYMMPVGRHDMNVEFMDQSCTVRNEGQLNVDVSGRHMFMVGLADFTLSDNSISGSIEPLSVDDRYDDDFLIEGRLAFYLKGKIRGKYLITAQLDTQEEELSNLLDNLDEKNPRSIFRRLDPDRYYPVYGDDSTTIADTDSIGKMYLRADWDKSRAVWGNFHTGVTGTEFAQYNRSLYGGQFDWHSLNANAYGDSRTDLNLFVSENQAELGHSEFRGTGGSLYYLKHTDLLPGSEKLHIEIRDRDSARVLENITLVRGVDYEIDELQGRVMLTRPLMQITQLRGPTLIKDAPLDGNDAVLLADYEYIPGSFDADHVIMGARGRHWFGDHFALGGTYVEEGRGAGVTDYSLIGAEMILQATPHTYIKAEVAETEDSQVARFFSNNGGLNFDQVGPVGNIPNREGEAVGVEARINTKEWLNTQNEWVMAAWYRNTDEGFSVARRDDGYEVTESGLELTGQLGERWQIAGRASSVERKTLGDESSVGLQVDYQLSARSTLAAEVRQVQEQRTAQNINADGLIGALRYTRVLNERWEAYVQGQYTIDNDDGRYDNNDMGTIGLIARLNDKASLIGEYSSGHRGDGASLSLDYEINSRHRVYGTYTHSADRTDDLANDQVSVGQRSALSDQLSVFNEHQFSEYRDYAGISHVFGLDYAPRPGWSLGASYQTGDLETDTGLIERDSISGTLAYQGDRVKWSTKLELRDDTGTVSDQEQWVTSNRVDYKLSDNTRLLGRFNHSETDDNINANYNAQFTEAQIGMAYRPVDNNRFNALLKYTYLYDLRGFDQIQTGPDQRSKVFSMEGIYKLNPRWDVGGKYAHRTGELRTDRDNGDWFDSTTSFYALRGRYHLVRAWDAMAEYRWLDVEEADSTRTGWLVALDRHFGNNLKLGLGYNFTDYSDDLTNLDYDQKGWFINAVGKY